MPEADICVIFNPAAGRGRAERRLESLRRFLGARARFQPTERPGHAEELAFLAATSGFAIIGAAGGDGTVHEVANGLLRARRPEVSLAVYPIGSANDYANALQLKPEWWLRSDTDAVPRPVDVGLVRAAGGKERYFINGLGLGFNGAVTMESQRIRKLQGVFLYGLALLRVLCFQYTTPSMSVRIDESARLTPTLALSVAIGRREGNFVLAPDAVVDDGWFDYLHVGPLRRWQLLSRVPGMITGKLRLDHPLIWHGCCRRVRVQSEAPLPIHLDGEMFSRPGDDVREIEIQMLPAFLRVQRCRARG